MVVYAFFDYDLHTGIRPVIHSFNVNWAIFTPCFARCLHHEDNPATSFVTGMTVRLTSLVASRSRSVASGWKSLRSWLNCALSTILWKRCDGAPWREVHACCLDHQLNWLWPEFDHPCYTQEQGVNGVSCRSDVPGDDPETAFLHDSLRLGTSHLYVMDCIGEDEPSDDLYIC